eukprot:GFUD01033651.1.p1 GENE.GFUD01033651.1~~GFUD01033651.1.p1  ORF type:complete len:253 (-),score=54.69 GFUD01033651.1:134-892(-)
MSHSYQLSVDVAEINMPLASSVINWLTGNKEKVEESKNEETKEESIENDSREEETRRHIQNSENVKKEKEQRPGHNKEENSLTVTDATCSSFTGNKNIKSGFQNASTTTLAVENNPQNVVVSKAISGILYKTGSLKLQNQDEYSEELANSGLCLENQDECFADPADPAFLLQANMVRSGIWDINGMPTLAVEPNCDENSMGENAPGCLCPICLMALESSIFTTPCCSYQFHSGCISTWTASKHSCPMCRKKL